MAVLVQLLMGGSRTLTELSNLDRVTVGLRLDRVTVGLRLDGALAGDEHRAAGAHRPGCPVSRPS